MEVTNISGVPHRYADPASGRRFVWQPGETRDVPDDVAETILATHEGTKMMRGRPAPAPTVEPGAYVDRQMVPDRSAGSRRADGRKR